MELTCLEDFIQGDNAEALQNMFESFIDYCIELGLYGKKLMNTSMI